MLEIIFAIILIFSIFFTAINDVTKTIQRILAESKLRKYLQTNRIKLELKNEYCELRFIEDRFYCKERTDGKRKGRMFTVSGDKDHSMTMWGLINAQFNEKTKYNTLRKFYKTVRTVEYTQTEPDINDIDFYIDFDNYFLRNTIRRGYRRAFRTEEFFREHPSNPYPDFIMNQAQNEYCRLSLEKSPEGRFYLLCEEIWGKRKFIIECPNPGEVLTDFRNYYNKMETYIQLLVRFKHTEGLIIKQEEHSIPHKDIHQKPKQEKEQKPEEDKKEDVKKIKRTEERNLDL